MPFEFVVHIRQKVFVYCMKVNTANVTVVFMCVCVCVCVCLWKGAAVKLQV